MKYLLCDHWGGKVQDAKKTVANEQDDLMCWASACANVLAWTGWGFPQGQSFGDATSIFSYFQSHWADAAGYPQAGWEWWFTGNQVENVDVPGGGGFWKSVPDNFTKAYHAENIRANALPAIERYFNSGCGVVLELVSEQSGGHFITCWGFEKSADGRYLGIYVTDSDDNLQTLRYYEVLHDTSGTAGWASYVNWWYFTYYTASTQYLIGAVHALDRRLAGVPAAPSNLRIA